jgi:hypothetical protein
MSHLREVWAHLWNKCPKCLGKGCQACRLAGTWKKWFELRNSVELSENLAWQLWKVRNAYWRDTGRPFSFEREASQDRGQGHPKADEGSTTVTP